MPCRESNPAELCCLLLRKLPLLYRPSKVLMSFRA